MMEYKLSDYEISAIVRVLKEIRSVFKKDEDDPNKVIMYNTCGKSILEWMDITDSILKRVSVSEAIESSMNIKS